MKVVFSNEAEAELEAAAQYYGAVSPELRARFIGDVYEAHQRIADYPDAWPYLGKGVRRCSCERLPYGLVYRRVGEDLVKIYAVAHHRRRPGYWRRRLRKG